MGRANPENLGVTARSCQCDPAACAIRRGLGRAGPALPRWRVAGAVPLQSVIRRPCAPVLMRRRTERRPWSVSLPPPIAARCRGRTAPVARPRSPPIRPAPRWSSASIAHDALRRRCAAARRLGARCASPSPPTAHRGGRADAQRGGAECAVGPVVPAMPNLHSHAFQRALAGRTGRAGAVTTASGRGGRRCTRSSTASTPTRSRRSPRRPTSRWRRPDTRRSPNSTTCITIPRASPMRTRRSSRGASSRRRGRRASASRCCRCSMRTRASAARRPPPGQRRFVHYDRHVHAPVRPRLRAMPRARGYVLGVAPHSLRAVTPDELGRSSRSRRDGAPMHIHAAEQTREVDDCFAWSRMRPVEWLLDAGERRRALVHRARDAHDGGRERARWPRAARSRASRRPPKPTWATARSRRAPTSPPAARSASAAIRTRSSTRSPSCGSSSGRSGSRAQARNVLAAARAPIGQALWARGRARRRAGAGAADGRDRRRPARRPGRAECRRSGAGRAAARRVLDAAIFGPCRRPVRDVMVGGRWIVRDGRHRARKRCSPAIARRSRGSR